jgi:hypothetical protein
MLRGKIRADNVQNTQSEEKSLPKLIEQNLGWMAIWVVKGV